jgi:peptide subunit release factor 1 (eRF1)
LAEEEIERLESFDANGARVLSVYLDVDPAAQLRRSYQAAFEHLVRHAGETLDTQERDALMGEASDVRDWLNSRRPDGRGLAIFSCSRERLWEVYELPVRVEDHVVFEEKPDVAPLLELVDDYERYAVALVDKGGARLFTVFLGDVEEDEQLHGSLQDVARHLAGLARHEPFDRLVLAGPDEMTSELAGLLPRPLAQRVIAVMPGDLSMTTHEILEKTLAIERRIEREVEARILQELLDNAGPNGRATCGLEPTLDALWQKDVRTLVVADGVHVPGSECPACGRLEKGRVVVCPKCGAAMRETHDLFHRAMARVVEQTGRVEVVHDAAAERLQTEGDGLGALLRSRIQAA